MESNSPHDTQEEVVAVDSPAPSRRSAPPDSPAESPSQAAQEPSPPGAMRENFASLVATAVLALFFTTFLAQAFEIPSESMEDTLLVGDRPFVNKLSFSPATKWLKPLLPYEEIHRGDIIIFKHPAEAGRIHMVKRAIGLPGDRIKIVNRQVIVNGRMLDEGYKVHKMGTIEDYRDNFPGPPVGQVYAEWREEMPRHVNGNGELVVPAGHYFAMGDNRDYSLDSRYWGFVPRENILGRPLVLYWSMDLTREDYQTTGIGNRAVGFVSMLINLPRKTRWNRLFRTFPRVNP
jgi:signal peptidase I